MYAAHCEDDCINLQFIIYFDEVETNNPLGASKGKHKLGMRKCALMYDHHVVLHVALFYYTLGNIRPKLRATLKTIQLIAVVTTPNLKEYGYEPIVKPSIEVNSLAKV